MDYFNDIYLKRLNRFGIDYQSRIQGKRELDFELYLQKSVYRVDFKYNGWEQPGTLEKYKQDDLQIFQYLLTRRDLIMPAGTILKIRDQQYKTGYWMIFFLEDIHASGYNKYIVLKMNQQIEVDGEKIYCYLKGPKESFIRDTIKSHAASAIYLEDFNGYCLITQKTPFLRKDTYFTIGEDWEKTGYRVTGCDWHTVPGVEFVSLDPQYIRDESPIPARQPDDNNDDYYWLTGGEE